LLLVALLITVLPAAARMAQSNQAGSSALGDSASRAGTWEHFKGALTSRSSWVASCGSSSTASFPARRRYWVFLEGWRLRSCPVGPRAPQFPVDCPRQV
jgi:hypothetical protein